GNHNGDANQTDGEGLGEALHFYGHLRIIPRQWTAGSACPTLNGIPMSKLARRLTLTASAIILALVLGTVGFAVIEGYSPFEAFYMTLTTITTVGYGELRELSQAGRIFNSFVIFFGVTAMFFAIGAMTQTIIELELGEYFGKRRTR